jgi:hypothetical protein
MWTGDVGLTFAGGFGLAGDGRVIWGGSTQKCCAADAGEFVY